MEEDGELAGTKGHGEIAAASFGWPRNDMEEDGELAGTKGHGEIAESFRGRTRNDMLLDNLSELEVLRSYQSMRKESTNWGLPDH